MVTRPDPSDNRTGHDDEGVQLTDEELDYVMGGLSRVWTPLAEIQVTAAPPAPMQDPASVIAATGLKA